MATVFEPSRTLPVSAECDVLVCGGGIAGVSAALAAARTGAKVLLLEREFALGGLATLGLVTIYLPLCDGCGTQVSFGIAEELLRLSVRRGTMEPHNDPAAWLNGGTKEERTKERFELQYNPHVFAADAEQLLLDSGVEILYGTMAAGTLTEGGKITAVIVENKSGRSAIACRSVVDCTGDADVCRFAGEDTATYGPGNILAAWYYRNTADKGVRLKMLGFAEIPGQKSDTLVPRRFTGLDAKEISEFEIIGHQQILKDVMALRESDPTAVPVTTAAIPQFRMTRRVVGAETLDTEPTHTFVETSVGMISNWRKRGPVYEVPFGCLHGLKVRNLITAGRNISATDRMWDISRVIPCCAVFGQAAGTAAAMTDDFPALDVKTLQDRLIKDGVKLHWKDVEG